MKTILKFLILGSLLFLFTACPDNALDNNKRITFINNSDKDVAILLADGRGGGSIVYPDTLLPLNDMSHFGGAKKGSTIRSILKYPQDSIYLFVLDPDTIAKYPWEQIREDYNIIKRYGLSWKKLAENNDVIYP